MSDTRNCSVITTSFKDLQVAYITLINFAIFIAFLILFFIGRYILWEFGKRNVYTWGPGSRARTDSYSQVKENYDIIKDDTETAIETAREHHFFNWIWNYFSFGLKELKERVGVDAYLYQVFQLHLLFLMVLITVICIVVVLTVNVSICSKNSGSMSAIADTSISACLTCHTDYSSNLNITWMHSIITHVIVICGLIVAANYRRILYKYEYKGRFKHNAIQIRNLPQPRDKLEADTLRKDIITHFESTEKDIAGNGTKVEFVYDVVKYNFIHKKQREVEQLANTYGDLELQYNIQQLIYLQWRKFICCFSPINAFKYYSTLSAELKARETSAKDSAENRPQNIAFVQFPESIDALSILNKYLVWFRRPKSDIIYLRVPRWNLRRAPAPSDMIWENIRSSRKFLTIWYIRWFIINLAVLLVCVFFTTPAASLSILNFVLTGIITGNATIPNGSNSETESFTSLVKLLSNYVANKFDSSTLTIIQSLVIAYTAPLVQVILANLIPLVVAYTSYLEFHWTKSERQQAAIFKTFIFLQLMLLIFPSFSLTSVQFLVQKFATQAKTLNNTKMLFNNVTISAFTPDVGVFFLNYLNISAFVVILQIFQFPSLILYLYRKLSARNAHEVNKSQEVYTYTFKFGIQYAWVLAKVSIAIVYCTLFPLITISGTLYLILKILVDRYNLIYQAKYNKHFSGRISVHSRALRFLDFSLILAQVYVLILSILLQQVYGMDPALLICNSIMLSLTFSVVLLFVLGRWFQRKFYDCGLGLKAIFSNDDSELHTIQGDQQMFLEREETYDYFKIIDNKERGYLEETVDMIIV